MKKGLRKIAPWWEGTWARAEYGAPWVVRSLDYFVYDPDVYPRYEVGCWFMTMAVTHRHLLAIRLEGGLVTRKDYSNSYFIDPGPLAAFTTRLELAFNLLTDDWEMDSYDVADLETLERLENWIRLEERVRYARYTLGVWENQHTNSTFGHRQADINPIPSWKASETPWMRALSIQRAETAPEKPPWSLRTWLGASLLESLPLRSFSSPESAISRFLPLQSPKEASCSSKGSLRSKMSYRSPNGGDITAYATISSNSARKSEQLKIWIV